MRALEVLHEAGITRPHALKRVAGTSAGSLTAALIALGYTPAEARTLLLDLDLETGRTSRWLGRSSRRRRAPMGRAAREPRAP